MIESTPAELALRAYEEALCGRPYQKNFFFIKKDTTSDAFSVLEGVGYLIMELECGCPFAGRIDYQSMLNLEAGERLRNLAG